MSRLLNAFRSKPTSDTQSIKSSSNSGLHGEHEELDDLLHALDAANFIMDDAFDTAESELASRSSSFHIIGRAIVTFLKATLGFEQEIMKEAQKRLGAAEAASYAAHASCVKAGGSGWKSEIYDIGTEYLICYSQAQIMSAVVGVLNESLTESIKGFYKLRKAWGVLEQIAAMEKRFAERKGIKEGAKLFRVETNASQQNSVNEPLVSEKHDPLGLEKSGDVDMTDKDLTADADSEVLVDAADASPPNVNTGDSRQEPQLDPQTDPLHPYLAHPIDRFIHTTLSTQYGLLLLLLSLIPPAFSPILNIVGFRGNRSRGLALLWRSSSSNTVQGGIAALTLLEYYNGLTSFLDIQTDDAWPRERLRVLLDVMRQRYPNSAIWQKGEARMCSAEGDLETSITMLGGGSALTGNVESAGEENDSKAKFVASNDPQDTPSLKQIEAIRLFERALDSMYLHVYSLTSSTFQSCVDMNNWSHGLYYYIAAAAELELYWIYTHGGYLLSPSSTPSSTKSTPISISNRAPLATYVPISPNPEMALQHGQAAASLFEKAGPAANKKRLLARQLPFDAFITRKLAKWNALAKTQNAPLIDVITVSPLEEMQLFWGGHGRMRLPTLHECLRRLAFTDGDYSLLPSPSADEPRPVSKHAASLPPDDKASLALLRATALRRIGLLHLRSGSATAKQDAAASVAQARTLLQDQVITAYDWRSFKSTVGKNGDTWPLPMGRYEMAACFWTEGYQLADRTTTSGTEAATKSLHECSKMLEEVAKWESYDLDVRMGIRIGTGRRTLKKFGVGTGTGTAE